METFTGGVEFNVNSVSFGMYSINNNLPVTVRLYINSGAPFPEGTRTQIGSSTITVTPAQSGTVITTPLVATVPAGTSELVMELFTPSAIGAGTLFKVGANMAPETGLSYWSSAACSSCILPMDNHFVFNVYGSCAGGTSSPTPTGTPAATPIATPTAIPCGTIFAENFDSVLAPALPPGWVAQTYCSAPPWVTSTTTPDSGPNDAFIDNPTSLDDKRLDTPDMTISGQGAEVSFRNFYNLDLNGGVLEVSSPNINGGAFIDITNAAVGGSFATGGYNAMISEERWGPLAGRMAWSGNSGGYIDTVANLGPNVAGQTIKLRFRMGSAGGSSPGWRIDTVLVVATPCSSPSPTPTPAPTPTPTPTQTPTINISGTVLYCANPVPGRVPSVTLTLTGTMSGSTLSDGSGNYQFSSLASGGNYTVTPTKAARPPGSTGINTVDVVATQRHFLIIGTPLTGCRLTAADVNGDSGVNTVDVIAIQRFFLGQSTGIANTGKYQFIPASRSYPGVVSDQTGQNDDTLVLGDVATPFAEPRYLASEIE